MGAFAWRNCAGQVSDAVQFAVQMGFVERIPEGGWELHFEDLLCFFGWDGEHAMQSGIAVSFELWDNEFELMLAAAPMEEWTYGPLLSLSITIERHYGMQKRLPFNCHIPADRYGAHFWSEELGGYIAATQLMRLLSVLGETADEHAEWYYFQELA